MADRDNTPGPGRSTSEDALTQLKKEVAARNEAAHKAARERRAPAERAKADKRRRDSE